MKNDTPKTLDILCLIVREISVAALHGTTACSFAKPSKSLSSSVNNSATKKAPVSPSYEKQQHLSPTIAGLTGISHLGTVPLPKVIDYVEDVSDSEEEDSASDIPSQSSESSGDEHVCHYFYLLINLNCIILNRTLKMIKKKNGDKYFQVKLLKQLQDQLKNIKHIKIFFIN